MRAFVIKELNHPSKLSLSHGVPEPKASDNQVLVDIYSAGLNFFDVLQIFVTFLSGGSVSLFSDSSIARKIPAQALSAIYSWDRIRWKNLPRLTHPEGL
jgi:hypothetical protein